MDKQNQQPEITDEVKKSWPRSRSTRSSGGVAFRRAPDGPEIEVALIATRGGARWQLPKGSHEAGESSIQTAVREVEEEVGLKTEPVTFLESIEFWYWDTYRKEPSELVHKMVDFFLLRIVGGALSDESHEVDGVAWFTLDQAADVLTFDGERRVIGLATTALNEQDLL